MNAAGPKDRARPEDQFELDPDPQLSPSLMPLSEDPEYLCPGGSHLHDTKNGKQGTQPLEDLVG